MFKVNRLLIPRPDLLYQRFRLRRRPSALDMATVEEILRAYELELLTEPRLSANPGRSQSLVVLTDRGKMVLKRYIETVTVPAIIHEHSILAHLAQSDFPSPRLVSTPKGETLVCGNGRNYALFRFIEAGFPYYRYLLFPAQLRQFIGAAGEILAMLHSRLQGFEPRGYNLNGFKSRHEGRWWDLEWYISRLDHCVATTLQRNGDAGLNEAAWLLPRAGYLGESLRRLNASLEQAALPRLVIHGDYGPYNLLFTRDGSFSVLDFEIARLDWRATELVDALWRFSHGRLGFNLDKMKCFLDVYRAHSSVTTHELRLMPEVWLFLNVGRCIVRWHHYCNTQDRHWLVRARWFMELIDWMRENRDAFLARLV